MQIRRGVQSDAEDLSAAAERWFRETFSPDNTAEDMEIYCTSAFSPEIQNAELTDPAVETLLLQDSRGELIAYAQLRDGPPMASNCRRRLSWCASMSLRCTVAALRPV